MLHGVIGKYGVCIAGHVFCIPIAGRKRFNILYIINVWYMSSRGGLVRKSTILMVPTHGVTPEEGR